MIFSSNYGTSIHALLIINEYSKTQKVTSEFIADILGTNPVLVRNLLGTLKKTGFISIAPRKEKAGTRMAMLLEEITLFDIFKTVEPNYFKDISEPSTKFSNHTQAGIYINEIISGNVENSFDVLKEELKKTTLADILATLKEKEAEGLHDKTRELFSDL